MLVARQTEEFLAWLDDLKNIRVQVRIAARLRQAEAGNLADRKTVAGEVCEMRVNYGPGYRLYVVRRGRVVVNVLNGARKASQKRDIRRALALAARIGDEL